MAPKSSTSNITEVDKHPLTRSHAHKDRSQASLAYIQSLGQQEFGRDSFFTNPEEMIAALLGLAVI